MAASVVVLAGGAGTRIRHLYPNVPKPLIPVAGRPFLDWVAAYWSRQGAKRMIVSIGYLADVAESYFSSKPHPGMEIHAVREDQPLGTGGGLRLAASSPFVTDPFVAVNGDSLLFGDIACVWPRLAREDTDGVLLGVRVPDTSRFGSLNIGQDGRLIGFREKGPGQGVISAGVYFLKKQLLPLFPDCVPLSMEFDVFPALITAGARIYTQVIDGDFLDIGTPEALAGADTFIARHLPEMNGAQP